MKKIKFFMFSVCLAIVLMPSCATILSGTTDKVYFKSEPPDAKVLIDGVEVGTTNNDITIKRTYNDKRNVTLKKEGYEDLVFKYEVKIASAYWIGLLGGAVPMLIDIVTGACIKAKYDKYEKTLVPKK